MMDSFFVLLLLILLFFSAFFSSSETALFSISSLKIKAYRTDNDPRKRLIASLVLLPRDLLVTVFMMNTLVNILLQNVASSLFGAASGWSMRVGVPLVLTLIFGEIIPKYVGIINNQKIAYAVAPFINFTQNACASIRKFIITITAPISRILFFFLKKEESISKEELQHVLKTSEEHGVLNAGEAELIRGYLDFQEASVKELMRPREDMVCFDINEPLTKLLHLFTERQRSCLPVFDKEVNNMLGILSAKEFFLHRSRINKPQDVIHFITKPIYVPETMSARQLLRRLVDQKIPMAIAVNEYGSVEGLITIEDVLEVVMGSTGAEPHTSEAYTRSQKNEIIASGKMELAEFNDLFGIALDSPNNMVTLGGWLTEKLGEIPKSGTKYQTKEFLFQVLSSDPHRIRRIYVRRLAP